MMEKQFEKEVPLASLFLRKNIKNDQKVLSAKIHSEKMIHTDSVMGF